VLSHESIHLAGFYDEALADCLAIQIHARVASALGAGEAFARSTAREYLTDFEVPRTGMSAECRDGGDLDLFPDSAGWPTPSRYPADLDSALSVLRTKLRTASATP
jgi:hypothetical protein